MSDERFKIYHDGIRKFESNRIWGVKSETNSLEPYMTFKEAEKCCELLNEQQPIIQQQERKIRKCEAEVGRQLKQIIKLQDELNECRARPTIATDERGVVKVEYR